MQRCLFLDVSKLPDSNECICVSVSVCFPLQFLEFSMTTFYKKTEGASAQRPTPEAPCSLFFNISEEVMAAALTGLPQIEIRGRIQETVDGCSLRLAERSLSWEPTLRAHSPSGRRFETPERERARERARA
jgi:hypothetical protein